MENQRESASFENFKLHARGSSVTQIRNIWIPHMIMKHGWIGLALSKGKIPKEKVWRRKIVRDLTKGIGMKTKGVQPPTEDDEDDDDSDVEIHKLSMTNRTRSIDRDVETYVEIMMRKLVRAWILELGEEKKYSEEEIMRMWKSTPPNSRSGNKIVSPEQDEQSESEDAQDEDVQVDGNEEIKMFEMLKQRESELREKHKIEKKVKIELLKTEAQNKLRDREDRRREARKRAEKKFDAEEKSYLDGFHYLHGATKQRMDTGVMREWEAREEYRMAIEEEDLLLLWVSLELVIKRQGGETAFTVSAAKNALMNRKQGEHESISGYVSAVELLIANVRQAGGDLSYPESLATFIRNVDNNRFSEWQMDTIKNKLTEVEGMQVEDLMSNLLKWDLEVYRPCLLLKRNDNGVNTSNVQGKARANKDTRTTKRMCYDFQKGNCKYGDKCRFLHDIEESNVQVKNKGKGICYNFAAGKCERGEKCHFKHDTKLLEAIHKIRRMKKHQLPEQTCINDQEIKSNIVQINGKLRHGKWFKPKNNLYYKSTSDEGVICHDDGANISVARDKSIFRTETLKMYDQPILISETIKEGEGLYAHGEGKLQMPLEMIKAYYTPEATGNCVSGEDIRSNFSTRAHEKGATEIIHHNEDKEVTFCKNFENLLVLKHYGKNNEAGTNGIIRIVKQTTLSDKLQEEGISKDRINRAKLCGVLHKRMDYASWKKMEDIMDLNRYTDLKLDRNDLKLYWERLHDQTCCGCALGKQISYPSAVRDEPAIQCIGDVAYMDEFHISFKSQKRSHKTYMMVVDGYSNAKLSIPLYNQEERSILSAVDEVYNWYHKHGWVFKTIIWDHLPAHESLVSKIENKYNITVQFTAPGRHVTQAEVAIRDIKRSFLAILCGLNYKLHREYYNELITWCTDTHNMLINIKNDKLTPWEQLTKTKIRLEYYLGASFGEVVVVPNLGDRKSDSETSTTHTGALAIIVGRDWHTPGAMIVAKLDSKKRVSRMTYAPFELTSEIKCIIEAGTDINTEEIKDLVFTWKNIPDDAWGRIDVSDDVNIEPIVEATTTDHSIIDTEDNEIATDNSEGVFETGTDYIDNCVLSENDITPDGLENFEKVSPVIVIQNKKKKKMKNDSITKINTRSSLRRMGKFMRLSVKDAINKCGQKNTMEAIYQEVMQLINKGVFEFIHPDEVENRLENGEILLPSTLFLKDKYDSFNVFEKLKARLVVCGNFEELLEKFETESPTVSITTVLMVLEIAARNSLHIEAADIGGAYLHGVSNKKHLMKLGKNIAEIIITMEDGFKQFARKDGSLVVELKKCLYGLQEAAKVWYDLISNVLLRNNFKRSNWDKCSFIKVKDTGEYIYVLLYVDDLLIFAPEKGDVDMVILMLKKNFKNEVTIKEGSKISFLGLEININESNIKVSQSNYIKTIIQELAITKTAKSPAVAELMDRQPVGQQECNRQQYRRTIMRIMFAATRTRPDILYVTSILAGRCDQSSDIDWKYVIRLVEYLNGTIDDGLVYNKGSTWKLWMSVDASFNHHWDCKGHTGFVIYGSEDSNAAILVKSFKQKSVADSSTEAELIALHDGMKYLNWVSKLYAEFGYKSESKVQVLQDNQACIQLSSQDPINFRGRSKFIDRKYFSVYEHIQNGQVELVFTGTDDMVSDFLTKALNGSKYRKFKVLIMGIVMNN